MKSHKCLLYSIKLNLQLVVFATNLSSKIVHNLLLSTHFFINHSSGHLLAPEYSQSSPYILLLSADTKLFFRKSHGLVSFEKSWFSGNGGFGEKRSS